MTDSFPLAGKVAAVTGASSGIGQIIAETLGRAGAYVFLAGRSEAAMSASKTAIESAGGGATVASFDIRDTTALQGFVDNAAAHAGRLDIMVNNAGLGHSASIIDGSTEQWSEMLDVNVLGLLVGCQAAIRAMRRTGSNGHILNISSVAALRRDSGVYGATKHAVNTINATLRVELENDPIRVTSVMPGVFASNFVRNMDREFVMGVAGSIGMADVEFDQEGKLDRETLSELHSRMADTIGDPQEIADAILYVVQTPHTVNIEEFVIRPAKALPL
jgi:NADP-dependent 3-hydroxy acid dehydrogenase YdfG